MGRTMREIQLEQEVKNLKSKIESKNRIIKELEESKDFWRNAYDKTQEQLNQMFKLVKSYQEEKTDMLSR